MTEVLQEVESPLVPKLVLELEGVREEFHAKKSPNQWYMLEQAKAVASNDQMAVFAAVYNLAMSSVRDSEHERFVEYMQTHGDDEDTVEKLMESLGKLWAGETNLPLVPASVSSSSTQATDSTSTEN